MKVKYEYVVHTPDGDYVKFSREKARITKKVRGGTSITQRIYKLVEERKIR